MLSVIVPGAVDAWQTALERFGTRSLEELLQPAIQYAEDGYALTPVVAKAWHNNAAVLVPHAESRRDFLVDGRAPAAGSVHRQPRLAESLRRHCARWARCLLSRPDRGSHRASQPRSRRPARTR